MSGSLSHLTSLFSSLLGASDPFINAVFGIGSSSSTVTFVDQILGAPTLHTVFMTAPGTPQQNAVSSQVDGWQFQDPSFVERLAQCCVIPNNANSSCSTSLPSLTALAVQGQEVLA